MNEVNDDENHSMLPVEEFGGEETNKNNNYEAEPTPQGTAVKKEKDLKPKEYEMTDDKDPNT